MINHTTYSLEEVHLSFDGHAVYPEICSGCYQALDREPRGRSCPKSYAALAQDTHTYKVLDWKGLSSSTCRCCGTQNYGQRWTVEPVRKAR